MLPSSNGLNVLLLAVVVMCALSVVTSQHRARKLYIELQKQKEQARNMEVEWGQLQLEQSTWAALTRVEKIAGQQLQMQFPGSGQIRFVRVEQHSSHSSGGTDSHLTRSADGQAAGYTVSSEEDNRSLSLWEKGSKHFNDRTK